MNISARLGLRGRFYRHLEWNREVATSSGRVDGPTRGDARRACLTLAAGAAFAALLAAPGSAQALEQKLTASDGAASSFFGRSVAVDGDTAVVSAQGYGPGTSGLYVYTRSGDSWTQTAKLTASDGSKFASVAIDGDTIVGGAPWGANPGSPGAVYTFSRTGAAARTETAKLTASDGAADDNLGSAVAIDGDTIVAGAHADDSPAPDQGSLYTFARTGPAARTQTAKLTATDGAAGDYLGTSVAIDGDTIVAGASHDAPPTTEPGAVYTFARTGPAVRTQTAKLTATDGAGEDALGNSVAIDGDTIVAGAYGDDADQGSAYLFARTGPAARTQTAKLLASDPAPERFLGSEVAIEGPTIVVGQSDQGSNDALGGGAVYMFARTGEPLRTQTVKLRDPDGNNGDSFGTAVAISGDAIIAGASGDDVGANGQQGSATVFFAPAGVVGVPPPVSPPAGPGQTDSPKGTPPFPAKLEVLRARVVTSARRLDVLAPITTRASGRVNVSFQAAGRTTRFTAPVDATRGRVRINRVISALQARLGTGILTISYPGDADTQPQVVRLRAAPRHATLRAERPKITNGRLLARGRISTSASGVVRVQLLYEPAGQNTVALQYNARIRRARYTINQVLPAKVLAQISARRGVVHSYTLFTGYQGASMRGEMASYQILATR